MIEKYCILTYVVHVRIPSIEILVMVTPSTESDLIASTIRDRRLDHAEVFVKIEVGGHS